MFLILNGATSFTSTSIDRNKLFTLNLLSALNIKTLECVECFSRGQLMYASNNSTLRFFRFLSEKISLSIFTPSSVSRGHFLESCLLTAVNNIKSPQLITKFFGLFNFIDDCINLNNQI